MKIAFSPPDITQTEIDEVVDTLRSGWITTGPKTKAFEREIARACSTRAAVAMNSATACMELTLRILGVGPGDEVITSAYTYSASASVIQHVGASVVLVDTSPESFHLDYEGVSAAVTRRTKAIIPVDIAGVMCDYDRLHEVISGRAHLFSPSNVLQESIGRVAIVADAAHSFGATYENQPSGSVADFTCFSFHAVKNLTTAEGGAVTWRPLRDIPCQDLYRRFMLLALHGQTKDASAKSEAGSWEYDIVAPYYKCNMTDISASLGLAQMRRYPKMLQRRHDIIALYDRLCHDMGLSFLRHRTKYQVSSGHLYMTRLMGLDESRRNEVIQRMARRGVATNVHYKPLPMLAAYKDMGFSIECYPNAYSMYQNEITLPLHTLLSDNDVEYVCQELQSILGEVW